MYRSRSSLVFQCFQRMACNKQLATTYNKVFALNVSSKNQPAIQKEASQDKSQTKKGIQRSLHTTRIKPYNCNTPATFEPWTDEGVICVLQGSCMPGSTRYCRTNSMFGKMDMMDIMQGVPGVRRFTTFVGNPRFSPGVRTYHSRIACKLEDAVQATLSGPNNNHVNFDYSCNSVSVLKDKMYSYMQDASSQCYYSTSAVVSSPQAGDAIAKEPEVMSRRDKLKKAVKDYGSTVVVFHIGISLASLGGFYLAVSSGLDVAAMLKVVGFSEEVIQSRVATSTSTFVITYAVYKLFMPVRLATTLTVAPLLVQYLRRINVLKASVK